MNKPAFLLSFSLWSPPSTLNIPELREALVQEHIAAAKAHDSPDAGDFLPSALPVYPVWLSRVMGFKRSRALFKRSIRQFPLTLIFRESRRAIRRGRSRVKCAWPPEPECTIFGG